MALNNNFYSEIFEKEMYWMELIENNLLNIYYLDGKSGLKGFYETKKIQLESEYNKSKNEIQRQFLEMIIDIINQIDMLITNYRERKDINIKLLTNYFLSNQMNNNLNSNDNSNKNDDEIKQTRKRVLENFGNMYKASATDSEYLYDDFEEEVKPLRR